MDSVRLGVAPARGPGLPEVGLLGNAAQAGGKPHLRLNTCSRRIVNEYRKGKLKRTLKKEREKKQSLEERERPTEGTEEVRETESKRKEELEVVKRKQCVLFF